ncbi:MAG: SpoIID/LytB domain-containing protein [Armatimonadetes bacterium]|nr:MAG: SpoIID/LytB domain-containing protein [Armatimonadota bacterium]
MLLAHLAIAGIAAATGPLAPAEGLVRVILNRIGGVSSVEIRADEGLDLFLPNASEPAQEVKGGAPVQFRANGDRLEAGSLKAAEVVALPKGRTIEVKGKAQGTYRGRLRLRAEKGVVVVVNELGLEAYLMGVLASEMPPSFAPEALKAQAIAARTYTLSRMAGRAAALYDLDDTTSSQTYLGTAGERPQTNEAVRLTSNLVLLYEGAPIQALYCTVSGGVTAGNEEAFGGTPLPYLRPIQDLDESGSPYGAWSPHFQWEALLTDYPGLGALKRVEILERTPSGRAKRVRLVGAGGSLTVSGTEFRTRVGVNRVRSLLIDEAIPGSQGVLIRGRGWGHGVGLCQAGAQGRALAGQSYQQILEAYYPTAKLTFLPNPVLVARGKS